MTPDQAAAVRAIEHTQAVYTTEGDRGRIDGLLTAFTPDGVLEFHGRAHVGHPAIRAALTPTVDAGDRRSAGRVFLRHHLTTRRVEFDGPDDADAWTYFLVINPIGVDHAGVYVDRFARIADRWLISHRRVKIDWAAPESRQLKHL